MLRNDEFFSRRERAQAQVRSLPTEIISIPNLPPPEKNGSAGTALPIMSVVIPTKNEAGNIGVLLGRLACVAPDLPMEIVFVDDSSDETPRMVEEAARHCARDILLIHRAPDERTGGLGGAVTAGLRAARGEWVCVMDGDLQHPPELIPRLLSEATLATADVVVASRYCENGDATSFDPLRAVMSRGSTLAAHWLFPRRLRHVTDPMSGFFLVRRAAIDIECLRPRGFKILLEILCRTPALRVTSVPFEFGERYAEKSKASVQEGMRYLCQLMGLRLGHTTRRFTRFTRFGLVGLSGLVVNSLVLALVTELFGLFYLVGVIIATQCSTLWNFTLSERWVFGADNRRQGKLSRAALFFGMNNLALVVRTPLMFALTSLFGLNYLISNVMSLVGLMMLRYALADRMIWGIAAPVPSASLKAADPSTREGVPMSLPHNYDIHGIITVASEATLPELERFRIAGQIAEPTIRVRIGAVRMQPNKPGGGSLRQVRYLERPGAHGFAIEITFTPTIEILASPLLRRSPHVLYTNVVEPVLRWTFADKGYALVHGACVAVGEHAFLVTARTDTGKTTTILRTLDSQPHYAFLSDDLTLVSPDGRVLPYPKPLTISRHTLVAVNTPLLSRKERLGLVFQSRLHSKSGRWFGLLLSKSRLPMATTNAVIQYLVPPPKYQVERLVPHVRIAGEATLAGLIVIERGSGTQVHLDEQEALSILLANCEDSYGFPPYANIKETLYHADDRDLRDVERQIVASAMQACPAVLMRSETRDWWTMVPAFVTGVVGMHDISRAEVAGGTWSPPMIRADQDQSIAVRATLSSKVIRVAHRYVRRAGSVEPVQSASD